MIWEQRQSLLMIPVPQTQPDRLPTPPSRHRLRSDGTAESPLNMNCCCQGLPHNGHRSAWILVLLVILGSCMHPILKSIFCHIHSAITGSYISGTHSLVFVNCPNEQIAKEIARGTLEKRLAASVNIMPRTPVLSIWNGEIEESTEILLIIRSKTSMMPELFAYIR
ncbi:hypothetical protein XENTR_v10020121 [Xenopus tropicalis]|nr:hypothetical protein XENTR_v10020121 [Xenopus tropicalis]|eukprot:XP_002935271.2 PREDICTED: protein CutA homolog [Xenopus tropicalis]